MKGDERSREGSRTGDMMKSAAEAQLLIANGIPSEKASTREGDGRSVESVSTTDYWYEIPAYLAPPWF